MKIANGSGRLGLAAVVALLVVACSDSPDVVAPSVAAPEIAGGELDDPTRAGDYLSPFTLDGPTTGGPALVHGPGGTTTITFSTSSFFTDNTIPGNGQAFIEDGVRVTSFWWQGSPIFGHFHIFGSGIENHHFQGDFARQGVRLRRQDGQNFTLQSIDYRSQGFLDTPFEIGTAPVTGVSGSPTVANGFTTVPVSPTGGSFVTIPISGFENVSEVWITQRRGGGWDNIVVGPAAIQVAIDVKPGSDPSSWNCRNTKGSIPVAILSDDDFDATTVGANTVRFGKDGDEAAEIHQKAGEAKRHEEDVDGDGLTDLVFHFAFGETGFSCDDVPAGENDATLTANLTGETMDGQDIEGAGDIRLVAGG